MAGNHDQEGLVQEVNEAELLAALRGQTPKIPPALALAEGVRRKLEGLVPALAEIAVAKNLPVDVRAGAIDELGRRADPYAQDALQNVLREGDNPSEIRRAAIALGRIGDAKAIKTLSALRVGDDNPVSRQVAAAIRLVAFRNGVDGYRFERPSPEAILTLPRTKVVKSKIVPVESQSVEGHIEQIRREVPGVELSRRDAIEVHCQGSRLWVLHAVGIENRTGQKKITEAPGLPAVLMAFGECSEQLYLQAYVMSQPGGKGANEGVELRVVRLRGDVTHFGEAHATANKADFQIATLNTRLAPVADIRGEFKRAKGNLSLTSIRVATGPVKEQEPRRQPRAVPLQTVSRL